MIQIQIHVNGYLSTIPFVISALTPCNFSRGTPYKSTIVLSFSMSESAYLSISLTVSTR